MHSPLEQFEVKRLIAFKFGNFDLSFTNSSLMMLISLLVVIILNFLVMRAQSYRTLNYSKLGKLVKVAGRDSELKKDLEERIVPGYTAVICEKIYSMVANLTNTTAGKEAEKFIPFIFTIYIFVLLCNILGMVPGAFTVTSHISVTFALAGAIFIIVTIIGFVRHGFGYFRVFVPSGVPAALAPIIFIIEFFAYLARPVSLSLRLTANMTAGHIILKVVIAMIIMTGIAGFLPFTFLVIMSAFEIFIAILQAYIFTILTCIYLHDALSLH